MPEFRDRLNRPWPVVLTPQVRNRLSHATGAELADAIGVAELGALASFASRQKSHAGPRGIVGPAWRLSRIPTAWRRKGDLESGANQSKPHGVELVSYRRQKRRRGGVARSTNPAGLWTPTELAGLALRTWRMNTRSRSTIGNCG